MTEPGAQVRGAGREADRVADLGRRALWLLLLASWVVAVWFMWEAMTAIPSAERLQESRLVEIPGPRRFLAAAVFSAMELAVVLAALWPWRTAYYGSRLAVMALATMTWFVITTPLEVSRMDWVHRRWLAFLVVAQLLALGALLLYRAARKTRQTGDKRSQNRGE
ncbi:MAG: hypothetical protein ACOCUW_00215 [Gemmatimonadota bacterium]